MKPQDQDEDCLNSPYSTTTYSGEDDILVDTAPINDPSDKTTSFDYVGVNIQFPYEAYHCQEQLMETIIQGVNKGQNCLLESPTGTGKTAALLCSLLAWQQHQDKKPEEAPPKRIKTEVSKIFYATRTLKHIDQIIDQLRVTSYCNTPMAILTSMKNTCNNKSNAPLRSDPLGLTTDDDIDEHYCQFNPTGLKWSQHLNRQHEDKTWNIEELKTFSVKNETCPYFELLEAAKGAKIIFCTYGYLLKADMRKAIDLNLENSILVFDEGHNVEDVCYQIASTPKNFPTSKNLSKFGSVLASELNSSGKQSEKETSLQRLSEALLRFHDFLSRRKYDQKPLPRTDPFVPNTELYRNVFEYKYENFKADLTSIDFGPDNLPGLRECCDILNNRSEQDIRSNGRYTKLSRAAREALRFLADLLRVLEFLWEGHPHSLNKPEFKIYRRKLSESETEIRIMCLSPAVVFKHMAVARSVIITSGTLSPLESFSSQMGIEFEHQIAERHIVKPEQVFCRVINKYKGLNKKLEITYDNYSDPTKWEDIQDQIAKVVIETCRNVRKGVVVFLPSEAFASKLGRTWKDNGHSKAIECLKKPFYECKSMKPEGVKELLDDYRKNAENSGAILFAYMRGKFSEGIDFKDDHARALLTVGIPYLPKELFVIKKMTYQNDIVASCNKSDYRYLNGYEWYANNAFRALNQAIGRNIRHEEDWGAILMLETRLSQEDHQKRLPNWIRVTLSNPDEEKPKVATAPAWPWTEVCLELPGFEAQFEKC